MIRLFHKCLSKLKLNVQKVDKVTYLPPTVITLLNNYFLGDTVTNIILCSVDRRVRTFMQCFCNLTLYRVLDKMRTLTNILLLCYSNIVPQHVF